MSDPTKEQLERVCAVQTVHVTAIHLRALKLTLAGVYHAAPRGSEVEKNVGAAYQSLSEILAFVEMKAAVLPSEVALQQESSVPPPIDENGSAPPRLH